MQGWRPPEIKTKLKTNEKYFNFCCKVDGLAMDLDNAQKETRNTSSDLFKVKNAYDEAVLQLDEVRR